MGTINTFKFMPDFDIDRTIDGIIDLYNDINTHLPDDFYLFRIAISETGPNCNSASKYAFAADYKTALDIMIEAISAIRDANEYINIEFDNKLFNYTIGKESTMMLDLYIKAHRYTPCITRNDIMKSLNISYNISIIATKIISNNTSFNPNNVSVIVSESMLKGREGTIGFQYVDTASIHSLNHIFPDFLNGYNASVRIIKLPPLVKSYKEFKEFDDSALHFF